MVTAERLENPGGIQQVYWHTCPNLKLNVVRLPMMFKSGIFIPISQLPAWGRVISWFSPVSYAVDLPGGAVASRATSGR